MVQDQFRDNLPYSKGIEDIRVPQPLVEEVLQEEEVLNLDDAEFSQFEKECEEAVDQGIKASEPFKFLKPEPILPDNPIMQALTRPTTPGGTTIYRSKLPDPVYMVPEGYKVSAHDKEIVNIPAPIEPKITTYSPIYSTYKAEPITTVTTSSSYKAQEPVTMSTSSSYQKPEPEVIVSSIVKPPESITDRIKSSPPQPLAIKKAEPLKEAPKPQILTP